MPISRPKSISKSRATPRVGGSPSTWTPVRYRGSGKYLSNLPARPSTSARTPVRAPAYRGRGSYCGDYWRSVPESTDPFWDRIRSGTERTGMGLEDNDIHDLSYGAINLRRRHLMSRMGYEPAEINRMMSMGFGPLGLFLSEELGRRGVAVPSFLQNVSNQVTIRNERQSALGRTAVRRRHSVVVEGDEDDDRAHRAWQREQENP